MPGHTDAPDLDIGGSGSFASLLWYTRRIAANFAKLPELSCVPLKSTRGVVKSTVADLQHKSFWPGRHRFAAAGTQFAVTI